MENMPTVNVTAISDIKQFDGLKDNWDAVYAADPDATVFVSWAWLRGWIEHTSYDWLALVIQPDACSPFVAAMVIGLEQAGKNRNGVHYSLHMGGHPFSDHTGFVCLPDRVAEAIPAFADFIKNHLQWNECNLKKVFDPRLDIFLRCFSPKKYRLQELKASSSPQISLPDTWDHYLQNVLSSNIRHNLKRYPKRLESLENFRVTQPQADTIDVHIETLLALWKSRWRLTADDVFMGVNLEDTINIFRSVLLRCFNDRYLRMQMLWQGDVPIAGSVIFLDGKKHYYIFYLLAVNHDFTKLYPGIVITGYEIRYAIENGFRVFDFGLGDEDYKFSFCAQERMARNITVRPMSLTDYLKSRLRIKNRLRTICKWGKTRWVEL
jgi:hypothetical protein